MCWKKMSYWLKCGIILGLISVISIIMIVLVSENGNLRCEPIPSSDYFIECNLFMWILQPMIFVNIIIFFIVGFLIGAIIGFIVDRIKLKNKKNKSNNRKK